jgi:Fe2+ transport system protein FeoA
MAFKATSFLDHSIFYKHFYQAYKSQSVSVAHRFQIRQLGCYVNDIQVDEKREEVIMTVKADSREILLTELEVGNQAVISRIEARDKKTLNKLMAMGVLAGMKVSLTQKFPSYVFKVGNTRIAADEKITALPFL